MKRNTYWIIICVIVSLAFAPFAFAKVTAEEAEQLGTTLTGVGAEKAGNKEGTIPEYTGGIKELPAGYKKGQGRFVDPFSEDRILFSINSQNMKEHADKLSEGTKKMMEIYPTFRIDVYPTRRSVAFPDWVLENTKKNALTAHLTDDGDTLNDAWGGYPFPIPKSGSEAMWNHTLQYKGKAVNNNYQGHVVDKSGRVMLSQLQEYMIDYPYYIEGGPKSHEKYYAIGRFHSNGPARNKGRRAILRYHLDQKIGLVAYQYLPGQRRVKVAPEIAHDGLDTNSSAGQNTYDEGWGFNGSMERYNWKLVGKKEMYIPYNVYGMFGVDTDPANMWFRHHWNPDRIRFELHRVWVVEATLKADKRHIYHKRVMYLDEDAWNPGAVDIYDAEGNLFKSDYTLQVPNYEAKASQADTYVCFNLITGIYSTMCWWGAEGGYVRTVEPRPEWWFLPSNMAGSGIR